MVVNQCTVEGHLLNKMILTELKLLKSDKKIFIDDWIYIYYSAAL